MADLNLEEHRYLCSGFFYFCGKRCRIKEPEAASSPLSNRSPDRLGQQAVTLRGAAFFTAPDHLLGVPQSLNGLAVTLGVADLEAVAPQSINR